MLDLKRVHFPGEETDMWGCRSRRGRPRWRDYLLEVEREGGGPAQQKVQAVRKTLYQLYGIYVLVPNAYEISNYYEVILDRVRGWPRSAFHTFDWTELTEEATGLAQETAAFNPGSVPALARFLRGTR